MKTLLPFERDNRCMELEYRLIPEAIATGIDVTAMVAELKELREDQADGDRYFKALSMTN